MDRDWLITTDLRHLSLRANNIAAKKKAANQFMQTGLRTFDWQQLFTWLWRWLPLRFLKRQSPLPTTVLLRTTLTRTIKLHCLPIYCTEFLLTISIQYQADKSDENKVKYQLGDHDYKFIQYQILQTNLTRIAWQTVTRITNEILGVKGLRCYTTVKVLYQSDRWKLIDKESKPA